MSDLIPDMVMNWMRSYRYAELRLVLCPDQDTPQDIHIFWKRRFENMVALDLEWHLGAFGQIFCKFADIWGKSDTQFAMAMRVLSYLDEHHVAREKVRAQQRWWSRWAYSTQVAQPLWWLHRQQVWDSDVSVIYPAAVVSNFVITPYLGVMATDPVL